ncbi:hypothetical protein CROQUDRAFT_86309 [Cronartium quercuum f. sp. fusiforme G11]|uniref:Uncharacterized protein n=1 Tax=Cronartium quercuum f. sp. fusiforme G11 TaxID=708437 RepID=A0A9P6NU62_9BASI|nr:hypothetical protein CROQUDRAFT_86309 [Cronartium quercuum f. sp. fusiforme G11]
MTIRSSLLLTAFAGSNPTLGRYRGHKLDLINSFLQQYSQTCAFCLIVTFGPYEANERRISNEVEWGAKV